MSNVIETPIRVERKRAQRAETIRRKVVRQHKYAGAAARRAAR
jgi:hypothetical protein